MEHARVSGAFSRIPKLFFFSLNASLFMLLCRLVPIPGSQCRLQLFGCASIAAEAQSSIGFGFRKWFWEVGF
jgi:hypothetical protein